VTISALQWLIALVRARIGAAPRYQQHPDGIAVAAGAWLGEVVASERFAGGAGAERRASVRSGRTLRFQS
jgi:hypothetical protein